MITTLHRGVRPNVYSNTWGGGRLPEAIKSQQQQSALIVVSQSVTDKVRQ